MARHRRPSGGQAMTRCANTEALSAHSDQPDPIGQEDGETCGRYAEPDDDTPSDRRNHPSC